MQEDRSQPPAAGEPAQDTQPEQPATPPQETQQAQQIETYAPLPQETLVKKSQRSWLKPVAVGLLVVAVGVGSFFGGMAVGENNEPTQVAVGGGGQDGQTMPTQPDDFMAGGMRGGMGAMGEVSAVSSSGISIEDMRSGEASTYEINASTEILDNGDTAKVSDIEVGDSVMVIASDSDEDVAAQIIIDPAMGGPGGQGAVPPGGTAEPESSDSSST